MVDFALNSVVRSIGVSKYTCKFWGTIHISAMAEARALKLCTKGDYNKCGQWDAKLP